MLLVVGSSVNNGSTDVLQDYYSRNRVILQGGEYPVVRSNVIGLVPGDGAAALSDTIAGVVQSSVYAERALAVAVTLAPWAKNVHSQNT